MATKKREILKGGRTKFGKKVSQSSKEYLLRQAKDVYVKMAIEQGYHSRAAFKLKEINDKHKIIKPGMTVVDLGAAPGGWCQVVKEEMSKDGKGLGGGQIFGLDKIWMEEVEEVNFIKGDFTKDDVLEDLLYKCPEKLNVVLSDLAPETSGHDATDHLRIMNLVEMAGDFALKMLKPNGTFVCKIFQGGEEIKFRETMRKHFEKVQFIKPKSSRKGSREVFLLCLRFKG